MPQLLLKVKFVKKLKLCYRALSFLSYSFFESFIGRNSNTLKFTLKVKIQFFSLSSHRVMKPLPLSNSRAFISLQREALSPLAGIPFSPWVPQFLAITYTFSVYRFTYSRHFINLGLCNMWPFVTGFFLHVFKVHLYVASICTSFLFIAE